MNTTTHSENTALAAVSTMTAPAHRNNSATDLMLDANSMDKMMRLAEIMASGKSTLPVHLRGNPGDCLAIVMQAVTWGINPFAAAQKTHVINGVLGYEAQLVASVVNNSGIVKDRFNFEWFGDWKRVIGKFAIKKGDKGEYRVPGWTLADEEGMGVKVWATLKGESEPRVLELLLAQARTRNSTLWADDPKQQLAYLAQKRWARLYAPDVILGVYSPDEFDAPAPRDMGSVQVIPTSEQGASDELVKAARAAAAQGKAAFAKFFNTTPKDIRPQLRHIRAELDQTAADFDAARTVETPPSQPAAAQTTQVNKTLDQVMKMLDDAKNIDQLYVAGDWVGDIPDPEERKLAAAKFDERKFVLEME